MPNFLNQFKYLLNGRNSSTATIQTLVVKIFVIALNLSTGIITARSLGLEGRGELAAIILWPQFLAYTLTLGIPQSLIYNLKRFPDRKNELFSLALIFSIIFGALASLIGILFIPKWLYQYPQEIIRSAQWFMIFTPFSLLGVVFTSIFEVREEFTFANKLRYLVPLSTLSLLLILIVINVKNPVAFGLAYTIPNLPVTMWMYTKLVHSYKFSLHNSLNTSFKLLNYGIKAYGVELLSSLSAKVGEALVVGLLTAASMGLFTIAISMSRMLNVFEDAILTVLFPKASGRPIEEVIQMTGRATRFSTTLTLLCIIPLFLLGPFFIKFLYGKDFVGASTVFRILLIEVLLNGITWMLSKTFMAVGKPGIVTALQGFAFSVQVPLLLYLVPRYGLIGAGISILLTTCLRLAFILISYPVALKLKPPSLILTYSDIRYLKKALDPKLQ